MWDWKIFNWWFETRDDLALRFICFQMCSFDASNHQPNIRTKSSFLFCYYLLQIIDGQNVWKNLSFYLVSKKSYYLLQIIDETLGQNLPFYSVIICFKSSKKYLTKKNLGSLSLDMFHHEGIITSNIWIYQKKSDLKIHVLRKVDCRVILSTNTK